MECVIIRKKGKKLNGNTFSLRFLFLYLSLSQCEVGDVYRRVLSPMFRHHQTVALLSSQNHVIQIHLVVTVYGFVS